MHIEGFLHFYSWVWTLVDHRSDGYLFTSSIIPLCGIIFVYIFITCYGPRLMENRPPIQTKIPVYAFCIFIVFFNIYTFAQVFEGSYRQNYNYACDVLHSNITTEYELLVVKGTFSYFILKMCEMFDSLLVIMYKVKNQPNLFFIFHHTTMVVVGWISIRFTPSGSIVVYGLLNTFVHSVMYMYVACFYSGKECLKRKSVQCLKVLVGVLQMIQYLTMEIFSINGIVTNCGFPHFIFYMFISYLPALGLLPIIANPPEKHAKRATRIKTKEEGIASGFAEIKKELENLEDSLITKNK